MKRLIESTLISRLKTWRCVALLGSRQVGKSYLLASILKTHAGKLLSFDDPKEREEAKRDPLHYLESRYQPGKFLFIDEAARVPDIFSAVKVLVDRHDPKPTGICVANSGNYLLLRKIKESLAGRVTLLPIYPLSWREFSGHTQMPGLLNLCNGSAPKRIKRPSSIFDITRQREERLLWGGMPQPSLNADQSFRILWANDYVRTYILPLVIEQFNIRESSAFEQAARLIILQNSHFFNANKLAQQVGISQPTLKAYSYFLEAMMVVHTLPIFFRNLKKRLIKQSKVYVTDPLLFNHTADNFSLSKAIEKNEIGSMYEAFIFNEIQKTISNYNILAKCYTWRTQDKAEVDIVLTSNGHIIPLEIKWSTKLTKRDTSGLLSFMKSHPEVKKGYIIYPGNELQTLTKNIMAVPDWWLLGCYKL